MDDQGLEDAAILLMSIGEEEAAEVFKHLAPKEVQRLGETIAKLKTIPRERVDGPLRAVAVPDEQAEPEGPRNVTGQQQGRAQRLRSDDPVGGVPVDRPAREVVPRRVLGVATDPGDGFVDEQPRPAHDDPSAIARATRRSMTSPSDQPAAAIIRGYRL